MSNLKNHPKIIAVDFDGTIVKNAPHIHLLTDFILQLNAKEVLQWAKQHFFLILWTCREDDVLQRALNFLNKHQIKFDAVNENAPFLDFPTSEKIFADYYVDDRARAAKIDWLKIKQELMKLLEPVDDEKIVKQVVVEVTKC